MSAHESHESSHESTVGFIGLGIMGTGMAQNLLAAGHQVVVYNRSPEKAKPLAEQGAQVASSPREVAHASSVVFVCVSDTPDVEQVLFGEHGVAEGLRIGSIVVDCSTVSPEATKVWAKRLDSQGVRFVDAPVSGGSEGAKNGTLSIMVGGSPEDVDRVRPYLEAIGQTITHVGPTGSGQTCKLVNQILVVTAMLGVAEALVFAKAGGLDLEKTLAAVTGGAGGSWMLANRGPQVIARDWRPGFTIDLQQKDLRLVEETARALGVPVLATAQISQLYQILQREGHGGDGNHALVRALERLAGVEAVRE
ncbi:MAG TPA: NAD(P)-dependent oxidoreductase [Actinopolymorphaceae bacterium]